MVLKNETVVLRYIKESDIEDYITWTTIETEWRDWDSPWEWARYRNIDAYNDGFIKQQRIAVEYTPKSIYRELEIDTVTGRHIGWVKSYYMDKDRDKTAVGIVIPSANDRGRGYGESALVLYMTYLFNTKNKLNDTYTETLYAETWSGNAAMIRLAEKIGCIESERKANRHEVRGQRYDSLTFSISKEHFFAKYR
ncbi:MAG: GNAT family N-acetyltransferase [Oscillospiraceae bacterium]|nr:GNAT family N-acetyltransferase [Oscillospiraceae bacterium]